MSAIVPAIAAIVAADEHERALEDEEFDKLQREKCTCTSSRTCARCLAIRRLT